MDDIKSFFNWIAVGNQIFCFCHNFITEKNILVIFCALNALKNWFRNLGDYQVFESNLKLNIAYFLPQYGKNDK